MAARFSRTTQALASDGSRASLIAWGIGAVLAVAWAVWFVRAELTVYEVSRKARIEVHQAAHPLASAMPGRLSVSHLAIGRRVRAGEVLVELDDSAARWRLQEERARLAAIAPRIASLHKEIAHREQAEAREQRAGVAAQLATRHRIEESEATIAFAREQERRLTEESQAGSMPRVDAQRAAAETRRLSAQRDGLAAEQRRLDAENQTRGSQSQAQIEALRRLVATLEGERTSAQVAIERVTAEIDRHRVRAPVDGRVGEIAPLRAGAWVAEGATLATLVPDGDHRLVAEFPPASVFGRIRPGQPARLKLDGFPWAQYGSLEARVSEVGAEIRDQAVRVELAIAPDAARRIQLQHGLPGSVEIAIERTTPALLVLRSAGQWFARDARAEAPASGSPR